MRHVLMLLLAVMGVALFGSSVSAFLTEPLDLKSHSAHADVICDGRMLGIEPGPAGDRDLAGAVVTFRVGRVFKGTIESGTTIVIRYPADYTLLAEQFSDYDLVLIQKEGADFVFVKPPFSTMPVSEKAYSPYGPTDDVNVNLQWEVLNSLKSSNPVAIIGVLAQVSLLQESDVVTHVRPLLDNPNPSVSEAAIVALARAGYPRPAFDYLQTHPEADLTSGTGGQIASSFSLSKPKLEDIAVLGNLLNFKQVQFRRLASSALRASSNEAAIPLLITALGDVDSEVRYNAVMGLAEMFDDSKHAPSYKYFLENQDYYIDYWKAKMARQS